MEMFIFPMFSEFPGNLSLAHTNLKIHFTFLLPFFWVIFSWLGILFVKIHDNINKNHKTTKHWIIQLIFFIFATICFLYSYLSIEHYCQENLTKNSFCYTWYGMN